MIKKDLQTYAAEHWSHFLSSVTELSKKDDNDQMPLVKSTVQMYSFDKICCTLFQGVNVPSSADGIEITSRSIRFIEFKSGFKKKITKYNFNEEKGRCPHSHEVCQDYWKLFFKNQQKETHELISSIRFKALESYLTLEKQLLSRCQDTQKPIQVTYTAVIDGDAVETMVDTLTELSGRKPTGSSPITDVKSALGRLAGLRDAMGNTYCYDRIEVLSVQDYKNQLRQRDE